MHGLSISDSLQTHPYVRLRVCVARVNGHKSDEEPSSQGPPPPPIYVFNGFFAALRETFTDPSASITWLVARFDNTFRRRGMDSFIVLVLATVVRDSSSLQ